MDETPPISPGSNDPARAMGITLTPGSAIAKATTSAPDLLIESVPDSPEGRRVEARRASGGTSISHVDLTGAFDVELAGELDLGRDNEQRAVKNLVQAMRSQGRKVERVAGARDQDGEDQLIRLDGRELPVQVVMLPVRGDAWRALAVEGRGLLHGDQDVLVGWIHEALEHKRHTAAGTILAVDGSHLGAPIGPDLVDAYRRAFGNPGPSFPFVEIWIIGPTSKWTLRLDG